MKRNSIKVIENSIFWQQHVHDNSKDPLQRSRCLNAIESLLYELMEAKREAREAEADRGVLEQAAWHDTSAELL
jgi:hypothetical protein